MYFGEFPMNFCSAYLYTAFMALPWKVRQVVNKPSFISKTLFLIYVPFCLEADSKRVRNRNRGFDQILSFSQISINDDKYGQWQQETKETSGYPFCGGTMQFNSGLFHQAMKAFCSFLGVTK